MELDSYIVTKYSELHLKRGNRKEFINVLIRNINNKFSDYSIIAKATFGRDRIIINSKNDLDKVPSVLRFIVGISSFAFYYDVKTDKEDIESLIRSKIGKQENFSFRVSAKIIDNDLFDNKDKMIE